MRVNAEWQARQVVMAKARVELSKLWDENDLSTLEWLSVLADEMASVTNRHRNQTECGPLRGSIDPRTVHAPEAGEPLP